MNAEKSTKPEPVLADDTIVVQSGLFNDEQTVIAEPPDPLATPFPPIVRTQPLTDQSSLAAFLSPTSRR